MAHILMMMVEDNYNMAGGITFGKCPNKQSKLYVQNVNWRFVYKQCDHMVLLGQLDSFLVISMYPQILTQVGESNVIVTDKSDDQN